MAAELIEAGVDLLFRLGRRRLRAALIAAVGKTPVTLGILPAGTANLFAANLGISTGLDETVEIGFSGRHRKLDVGAGNGWDANVWAGLRGVGRDAVQARVEVDGMAWFRGQRPASSSATWAR